MRGFFVDLGRALAVLWLVGAAPWSVAMAQSPFTRPAELEPDVQFWIRVYTEITTNEGFLHDERNLAVVYQKLHFDDEASPAERHARVESLRDHYRALLRHLASGSPAADDEEQHVLTLFGADATPERLREAAEGIRFQLGQADRFREGLTRSGTWEAHIADTLANLGLPPEISALPHVESSFNPDAYSKVGAAGLWQFMRSTGRRFLRIDDAVDERLDPFRATEAAAQLLDFNYRLLGTWPLALTAYNHGAAGMRRARDTLGTSDIVQIVRHYSSPSFGFASRNFYVSFLAALEIDRNPEKYFGPIERRPESRFREVEVPAYVPVATLARIYKVERGRLAALNPALLAPVWEGRRYVPRGYRLRLPSDAADWTSEQLAAHLAPGEKFGSQPRPRSYRVKSGDSLQSVAAALGVGVEELARMNRLKADARLKGGRVLQVPAAELAGGAPTPAAQAPTDGVYVVRAGDVLGDIASRVGVPASQLIALNQLKNPDSLYEGQRLRLSADRAGDAAQGPVAQTLSEQRAEDRVAASAAQRPAARSEPVSAAQAEAQGLALGPGAAIVQASDPVDYAVAADNSIRVAAAETLGHYADWLGVPATRLRALNDLGGSRAIVIGRRIRLDLSRTTKVEFEQKRREYHRQLGAAFFAAHRIVGTQIYVARRGDSLWALTQRFAQLPVWLLQQYNADLDFGDLRAGTQIIIPKVEDLPAL